MKKSLLIIVLVIVSCRNAPKSKIETNSNKDTTKIEILHPILAQGVIELVQTKDHLKYSDIPLNESFVVIDFLKYGEKGNINFSDTLIFITYNTFLRSDSSYKGILNMEGVNIAIFDQANFGDKYYDCNHIKKIPLENFKYYPMENIYSIKCNIKNGQLICRDLELIIPMKN